MHLLVAWGMGQVIRGGYYSINHAVYMYIESLPFPPNLIVCSSSVDSEDA